MRIAPTFDVALRALRRNKLRSVLTALGIIIGVGAVTSTCKSAIHSNSRRLSNKLFPCFGNGTTFVPDATTTSPYVTNRKSPKQPPLLHV